ncbi:GATA zinc finger domain-containing protein 14 [Condylostylus longicornis]|uniref:GATA zinc finger domain-containing protein 14 n=1 Tax=Condylostylus longicornis TaxID=2530218 RepID=UPI00244DCF5B|nr:GATA zinc finger domain-containing protein 14 [Condylostylus longicornis]
MLNGKFFTGLPPGMMNKSNANNRQKTNFFWPNDSDFGTLKDDIKVEKNLSNNNITYASGTSNNPEYEPENLLKKQLSSSIKFYDDVDKEDYQRSTRNNRKKIFDLPKQDTELNDQIDFKAKSAETFCSKIQFYDFPDNSNGASKSPQKERNNESQNESKNSVRDANLMNKPNQEDEIVLNRLNNFSNLNLKTKLVNKSTGNIPQIFDKKTDSKTIWNKETGIETKNSWKGQNHEATLEENENLQGLRIEKKRKNNKKQNERLKNIESTNSNEEVLLCKVPNNIGEQKVNYNTDYQNNDKLNDKNINNKQENDSLRHLKSSFSFDADDDAANIQRRKIRSRAFTRVTVGLPD